MANDRLYELDGKKGHWYTDEQGNRYFVAQGQTPKEGWEATKRRKMIKGGKYVKDDGDDKGEQEISADEYRTYEADEEERFDETVDADFEDDKPEDFDRDPLIDSEEPLFDEYELSTKKGIEEAKNFLDAKGVKDIYALNNEQFDALADEAAEKYGIDRELAQEFLVAPYDESTFLKPKKGDSQESEEAPKTKEEPETKGYKQQQTEYAKRLKEADAKYEPMYDELDKKGDELYKAYYYEQDPKKKAELKAQMDENDKKINALLDEWDKATGYKNKPQPKEGSFEKAFGGTSEVEDEKPSSVETKKAKTEEKARKLVSSRTDGQLVQLFDLTEIMPANQETAIVRGWIMDELQKRNPKAFDEWIDSEEDSPSRFFGKGV